MESQLTPQKFVENWRNTELSERVSYQAHFMDVCKLVGYETPSGSGTNTDGDDYAFEYGIKKLSGSQGFADVFLQKHFAIEYKAPKKFGIYAPLMTNSCNIGSSWKIRRYWL